MTEKLSRFSLRWKQDQLFSAAFAIVSCQSPRSRQPYPILEEIGYFWLRISIDEAVVEGAFGIIARHALRSLDALQLASVLGMQGELEPEDDLLFIATDKRLLRAAAAEGLPIWNPETSAPPAPFPPVN